jgi:hypothetical protein
MAARWDPATTLPTDRELIDKFLWLSEPVIGHDKTAALTDYILDLETEKAVDRFFQLCIA